MADQTLNRKYQIIEVAATLFRESGYEATSMRHIAQAMGIEASSLYHHIQSKEEILESICFSTAYKLLAGIHEVNDIYFNAGERLRTAIRNHVQVITSQPAQSAVFIREWRSLSHPRLEEFKKLRDDYEQQFRQILVDGENEDVFEAVDHKFAGLTILAAVNWVHEWYRPDGTESPQQIADKLSDFIMGGLRKKLVTDLNYKP